MINRRYLTPIAVLLFIILEIVAGAHTANPFPMSEIPVDRFANAVAKIDLRLPAELALRLAAIDRVTQVVPGTVLHVFDQRLGLAQKLQQREREVDVLDFLVAAEVIDLAVAPFRRAASIPRQ